MINLQPGSKIYFIGIGGVGMAATAGIAKSLGYEVVGSDSKEIYQPTLDILNESEIEYTTGYNSENVMKSGAQLFVISAGENLDNPEVRYVYDQEWEHVSFAEFLYETHKEQLRIVVAGTHGKSTTAGLLGHMIKNLEDGSFMTGAVLQNYGTNFYVGVGHYAVFEGDEYKAEFDDPTPKFHFYKPDILVLTNLEFDHPDVFENMEVLEAEFAELIDKMPEDGLIIYNADDPVLVKLVHKTNISSASFGIDNEADYKAEEIIYGENTTTVNVMNRFSKNISSHLLGLTEEYKIQIPGKINVYNSLAVVATLRALGFSHENIALDLLSFRGVKRRFEIVGLKNNITVIDDYAHHPTAVKATLDAARLKYPKAKIWAIFEPHTFSRTKATLNDLAKSFTEADEVLVSEIYAAREKEKDATISSKEVVVAIKQEQKNIKTQIRLVSSKQNALDILKTELRPTDVVVVMAVGNFNRLAYELRDQL